MINLLLKLLGTAVALVILTYIVPGITVVSFTTALIAGAIFGLINITIKPILTILAFPINILTLGFFGFIINVFCFWLISFFVSGFMISTINAAIIGSIVLALMMWVLNLFLD